MVSIKRSLSFLGNGYWTKPLGSDLSAPLQSHCPDPPRHFSRKEAPETFWAMVPLWGWGSVPPGPPNTQTQIRPSGPQEVPSHTIQQRGLYLHTDLCYIENSILNEPCHRVVKHLVNRLTGLQEREEKRERDCETGNKQSN